MYKYIIFNTIRYPTTTLSININKLYDNLNFMFQKIMIIKPYKIMKILGIFCIKVGKNFTILTSA